MATYIFIADGKIIEQITDIDDEIAQQHAVAESMRRQTNVSVARFVPFLVEPVIYPDKPYPDIVVELLDGNRELQNDFIRRVSALVNMSKEMPTELAILAELSKAHKELGKDPEAYNSRAMTIISKLLRRLGYRKLADEFDLLPDWGAGL